MSRFRWLFLPLLAAALVLGAFAARANPQAQMLWQLLDYIAVDYPGAVRDGKVISAIEYQEMQEFSATVGERLAQLPAHPARSGLQTEAAALQAAVAAKAAPAEVERLARALADDLLRAYPVPRAPDRVPDLAGAAALYQQHCASCHGATGAGDGPAGIALDPPPIDFTDAARARQRSVFALQQVIEQGLAGTAMASYARLPETDRWALAFYVGQLAFPQARMSRGEALWLQRADVRTAVPDLAALVQTLPGGIAGLDQAQADDLTAYLRRQPQAVAAGSAAGGVAPLTLARSRLQEGMVAYAAGDAHAARDKFLSAYLDGFEPVEPMLATRDKPLLAEVEAAMIALRAQVGARADVAAVQARVTEVAALFDRAEIAIGGGDAETGAGAAFVGALTILLREGLEALLLVIAMVAFLRKSDRTDAMPYIHGGWIGALLAGGATWLVATHLVEVSGASRELTEGFAALFAAAVLVSVGIWMHGKSQANAWQRYVREQMSQALSRGSAWFMFLLAFVIVYREAFETVLFYAALWSQGNHSAVLAGAATAVVALAAIGWLMLRYSRKLPFGQFFAVSALLMAVLAVVLAGKGVAALQEAGWLPVSLVPAPSIDLLGVHPTSQGLLAQLAVLLVLVAGFAWNARGARIAAR
ncbi:FTR1 family protein [Cognatiluteimonas weifangensis]|uniref:Iron permease n=1 Tax=Cognatiluteimonas weifangensis TaxID=2303539 RepID=A0A372DMM8_9GAMM|nr:FTR1 family protein [Luteimonas weifangensis]RFP60820.1 iron permease [Luteimonas weifangensis]